MAGFQDDIDSDDQQSTSNTPAITRSHVELSSDEEEEVTKSSSVAVTSSRDSVSDIDSPVPSSSHSDLQLPIQWTTGGSTSHGASGDDKPLDIRTKGVLQQDRSSCHGNASASDVSVSDKSDDDIDSVDNVATVTMLQDDVSDDEVTAAAAADQSIEDTVPAQQVNVHYT